MSRVALAAVLAAVAYASPARADPIAIRHDRSATAIALAGPDVLVMGQQGKAGLRVVALPRTGGPARTLLTVPGADHTRREENLAASPQRVGAIVEVDGTKSRPDEHRVYSGPPSGPLQLVRQTRDPDGDGWTPYDLSADGDRLLLVEGIPQYSEDDDADDYDEPPQVRAQILDSSGWTAIPWVTGERVPLAIAGPYAAVITSKRDHLEVVDLATGATLATVTGNWGEDSFTFDLAADGRIAASVERGLVVASPGQPERVVAGSAGLESPRFAGASMVAFDGPGAAFDVLGADGSRTTLGPRSHIQTDVVADDAGAAWLFNGCVRYAPLGAPLPPATADPCPKSEVAFALIGPESKLRGNAATVPMQCIASATGRCRGRLVARLDYETPIVGRGTFDVPVSDKWVKVPVHFDARTVAQFRREETSSALVNAIMRDGTVGAGADYSAEFGIEAG